MILAGDIGGTKTYLALIDPTRADLQPSVVKSCPSREYTSLLEIVRLFLREQSASLRSAAFGIAGPVVNGSSRLTNLSWHVDVREVADELGVQTVGLLNDLEAIASGRLHRGEKEKAVLQPGERRPGGAIAVIAAGTGLGEGGLFWDGRVYRAVPTERGHTDFAPRDELEMELLRFLLSRFKRVEWASCTSQ